MKLAELLAIELPKRGDWPADSKGMSQSAVDSEIYTHSDILKDFYPTGFICTEERGDSYTATLEDYLEELEKKKESEIKSTQLVDLLVSKHLKEGWRWPLGANECVQDENKVIKFFDSANLSYHKYLRSHDKFGGGWSGRARDKFICEYKDKIKADVLTTNHDTTIVTLAQFNDALWDKLLHTGNAQKSTVEHFWNSGVPPEGTRCEYTLNEGRTWHECTIKCVVGTQGVVMECDVFEGVQYVNFHTHGHDIFRPVPAQEEKEEARKRKEAIEYMEQQFSAQGGSSQRKVFGAIYDAFRQGKITL